MYKLKEKLLNLNIFLDNVYLDLYCELINNNLFTKKEKFKTQKHHIIPRCYYLSNKLRVDDSSLNIVNLVYRDHILAHYYLSLCMIGKYKYKMFCAILHILGNIKTKQPLNYDEITTYVKNLDKYQYLYESSLVEKSKQFKGRKLTPETIEKIRLTKLKNGTFKLSEETKKKISISNMGKSHKRGIVSEETRHKLSVCAKKRVGKLNNRWGKHLTEEHKQILRERQNKAVECIELNKIYGSLSEASEDTGAPISKISNCCRGSRLTTYGYHWRFVDGKKE